MPFVTNGDSQVGIIPVGKCRIGLQEVISGATRMIDTGKETAYSEKWDLSCFFRFCHFIAFQCRVMLPTRPQNDGQPASDKAPPPCWVSWC